MAESIPKKQKPNSGSFKKGDPRISTLQRRAAEAEDERLAAGGEPPPAATLFEDMQHVRLNPKILDRTQGQRAARAWFEARPELFMAKYADLEKLNHVKPESGQVGNHSSPAPEVVEDVEVLIQELISRALEGV